jgi:hypothetical protein
MASHPYRPRFAYWSKVGTTEGLNRSVKEQ